MVNFFHIFGLSAVPGIKAGVDGPWEQEEILDRMGGTLNNKRREEKDPGLLFTVCLFVP